MRYFITVMELTAFMAVCIFGLNYAFMDRGSEFMNSTINPIYFDNFTNEVNAMTSMMTIGLYLELAAAILFSIIVFLAYRRFFVKKPNKNTIVCTYVNCAFVCVVGFIPHQAFVASRMFTFYH